jgi:Ca-activated chloride channel homolog
MKKIILSAIVVLVTVSNALSNGVCIIDGKNGIYLKLISSEVNVNVENQVAIVTAIQKFKNERAAPVKISYAFPLPEAASSTGLRWDVGGGWFEAQIKPAPQDTTVPGPSGETHPNLKSFLGQTPLFFPVEQAIQPDSLLIVELTFVELLSYRNGNVDFYYPNNYSLLQSSELEYQRLNFSLASPRTIENLLLLSGHTITNLSNNGATANLQSGLTNAPANQDYHVRYSLNLSELGLFSLSTLIPDTLLPDPWGGFFLFVAEPDPSESTETINKVFTFIIDRSGSMSGDKIVQARAAATFIVEHLNEGDRFNIVDFASDVTSFRNGHIDYNLENEQAALSYISVINAGGSTNISGAFTVAVPQFSVATDTTANIIIFFTDGQATTGITDTDQIATHVKSKVTQNETDIAIFTFGIGGSANQQLLTLLATQNNGIAEFLGSDDLENRITDFYLQIRSPVLLDTKMSFSSQLILETYPDPLPNLYKGHQMIVTGRYQEPGTVTVTLNGTALGDEVSYEYNLELSDSAVQKNQFLTKIWAKHKLENLLVQYYLDPHSQQAEILKQQIIEFSIAYGVISPFTSYEPPATEVEQRDNLAEKKSRINSFELLGNYPNPFNSSTTIRFRVNKNVNHIVTIRIYNSLGQMIKVLFVKVDGTGTYDVNWNGLDEAGKRVSTGLYIYIVDFGEQLLGGKMYLIK